MSDAPKPIRRLGGGMLVGVLAAQVGKRMGLGKWMVRLALGRMMSRKKKARAFAGYAPSEHDVFVTTFAKSGTNWMMQIAQQVAHRGDASFDHIHDVVAWPDSPVAGPVALDDPAPLASSPTGLRVVKTHLEPEFVPYDEKAVYLTVLRDPKEVVVSSYYFLGGLLGVLSHVTIDDWLELFLRPPSVGSWWAVHTAGFWAWRDRANVRVLGYGEIHRDPRGAIERVAGAMGVRLRAEEMERVVRRSSFDYMRAHEWQFAPPRPPLASEADHPRMVRSGKAGASGELLSPSQQAAVDRFCREQLRRLGSDFPYGDFFEVVDA